MRVYYLKHHKIFLADSVVNEEQVVKVYDKLFEDILQHKSISGKKLCEVVNLGNYSITSKPVIVAALLRSKELPAFRFLVCKN